MSAMNGTRLRFFGGKGGVGKTTCAAAWALSAARAGDRTLVVSTDPAHSLGDALRSRLSGEPRSVRGYGGRLEACELDAGERWRRWLESSRAALRTLVARGTYLDPEEVDAFLAPTLPGVDELIGLIEVDGLARSGRYELIVIDTAPTAHALRLLAAPETLLGIASALRRMEEKHRYLAERFGGGARADPSSELVDELEGAAAASASRLRDPRRSSFTWVLQAESLPLEETCDAVAALHAMGIELAELVVNRLAPRPRGRCGYCERRRAAELDLLQALHRRFPSVPLRTVPLLEKEPRGAPALEEVGRRLRSRVRRPPPPGTPRERSRQAPDPPVDSPVPWLGALAPAGLELLFVAGKGGVGKTTCSAALGIALARRSPGRPVRIVSIDPAHSLGDVLGERLGGEPRGVRGAPPSLSALELDFRRLFENERGRFLEGAERLADAIEERSGLSASQDRAVLRDLLRVTPPGIDEALALLAVLERHRSPERGPRTVLDAAPTGHFLRLVDVMGAVEAWARALMRVLVRYRSVTGLGDLARYVTETSRRFREARALMADRERAGFIVVARPTELARRETVRLVAGLAERGLTVRGIIINAVTPGECASCRRRAADESRQITALGTTLRKGSPVPLVTAPATAPPPVGPTRILEWCRTWSVVGDR